MFEEFVSFFIGFGWEGIVTGLAILLGVYGLRKAGLVATGNQARAANLVLSAVLYGLTSTNDPDAALMAGVSSLIAAFSYNLLELTGLKVK